MNKGLAIFASPRKHGYSSTLHGVFLEQLSAYTVTRVHVYDLNINPCIACGRCRDEFVCPIEDDMEMIYRLMDECSFMSISTPLFFSGPPSPLKTLIDRCQPFWERRRRGDVCASRKKSFLIAVGGGEYPQMFEPLKRIMKHYLLSCGFEAHMDAWFFTSGTDGRTFTDSELHRAVSAGKKFVHSLKEDQIVADT